MPLTRNILVAGANVDMAFANFKVRSFAKVKRLLRDCNIMVQVCDARDIHGTRIFKIESGMQSKMIIAATKTDLVDVKKIGTVERTPKGVRVAYVSGRTSGGMGLLLEMIRKMAREKRGRIAAKAPNSPKLDEATKIVVFGIPNVGKSSVINSLAGRKVARTGFRAGITRGEQWIKLGGGLLLYDTPGVVDFNSDAQEMALSSALDAEKLRDPEAAAIAVIDRFLGQKNHSLAKFYGVEMQEDAESTLLEIAKKRGLLGKLGVPLVREASKIVVRDYQKGKFVLSRQN